MKRFAVLSFALLCLAGCGFRPLYAGQSMGATVAGQNIIVAEVAGRSGYVLRQSLIRDRSTGLPGLEGPSTLRIRLAENVGRAALLPDGAVARSFINATGRYTLETDNGPIRGEASVQVPFSATNTPYADVSAQTQAAERAMEELSRRIVEQLRVQAQNLP